MVVMIAAICTRTATAGCVRTRMRPQSGCSALLTPLACFANTSSLVVGFRSSDCFLHAQAHMHVCCDTQYIGCWTYTHTFLDAFVPGSLPHRPTLPCLCPSCPTGSISPTRSISPPTRTYAHIRTHTSLPKSTLPPHTLHAPPPPPPTGCCD